MKLYKSISPKNTDRPFQFEETSQKIYSFEGLAFYSLKNWMEAADVLGSKELLNWLLKVLGLTQEHGTLVNILEKDLSDYQKLVQFLKVCPFISSEAVSNLESEVNVWEEQALELQYKKRGDLAFAKKNFGKALKFYQKAQNVSFDPLVEHNIGATYMHLHFFDEAERAFHTALKHSDALSIHMNLIRLLKITGRTNEALARAKDLMKRYESSELFHECGTIYQIKGQYERAMDYYTKALQMSRNSETQIKMIEISMEMNTSEEVYDKIDAIKPVNKEAYYLLKSQMLQRENKTSEALELLEDGLIELGQSHKLALELSKVCRQKKQIIKAINAITKVQKSEVLQDEVLYEMALIAKRAGNRKDYEDKISEIEKIWKTSVRRRFTE